MFDNYLNLICLEIDEILVLWKPEELQERFSVFS